MGGCEVWCECGCGCGVSVGGCGVGVGVDAMLQHVCSCPLQEQLEALENDMAKHFAQNSAGETTFI